MDKNKIQYADDDTEPVKLLLRLRMPALAVGLLLGLVLSFVTSRFEEVLAANISVAFFIPFVVYLAAAVGAQTQSIYVRDLRTGKASFKKYLFKETMLGLILGVIFGLVTAFIVGFWFGSKELAQAVALAVLGAVAVAPLIALIVTEILELEHTDPAVGAGPLATVIQDTVSVLIYGFIASAIIL
ncbi:MAG: magnesium transporter [bacterium]|nr:magnesium transporter [bacterium]